MSWPDLELKRIGQLELAVGPMAKLKAWLVLQRDGEFCECGHERRYHYDEDWDGARNGKGHCEGSVPLCPCTEFVAKEK